ncbi:MAG: hypothetical protein Q8P03_00545 [bacterium]|nr:hypothetical protein [bacterium]
MTKLSLEQLRSVQGSMKRVPLLLAENAFLFTLVLIALAVAISLFAVFFSRASLKGSPQGSVQSEFQEKLFQDAFSELEAREADFAKPNTSNVPDIF